MDPPDGLNYIQWLTQKGEDTKYHNLKAEIYYARHDPPAPRFGKITDLEAPPIWDFLYEPVTTYMHEMMCQASDSVLLCRKY